MGERSNSGVLGVWFEAVDPIDGKTKRIAVELLADDDPFRAIKQRLALNQALGMQDGLVTVGVIDADGETVQLTPEAREAADVILDQIPGFERKR